PTRSHGPAAPPTPGPPLRRESRGPPATARGRAPGDSRDPVSPRFELDDLALRVGDPRVVHAQQLRDERLSDPFQVAQGQVALVELAIRDALLDDPRDHRPDRRLVPRLERAHGGLDAV